MEIYLNFRLDVLSSSAKKKADRIYESECGIGVNVLRLLRLICLKPGISPSELAELARFDRPKTSRMIRRLTDMKLIRRDATQNNGQLIHLEATEDGKQVFDRAQEILKRLEAAFVAPLTRDEVQNLITYLDKLTHWVEHDDFEQTFSRKQPTDCPP